jgi:hypothetical protein
MKAPLRSDNSLEQAVDLVDLFHYIGIPAYARVEPDRVWVAVGDVIFNEEDLPGAIRALATILENQRVPLI